MNQARQYVAVKFRPTDTRTYTYHNDGDPVSPGDEVKIKDRRGDGWSRVTVAEITDEKPPFETKPIIGRVEDVANKFTGVEDTQ